MDTGPATRRGKAFENTGSPPPSFIINDNIDIYNNIDNVREFYRMLESFIECLFRHWLPSGNYGFGTHVL